MEGLNAYKGKSVLVTGHTGFKGAWLSIWLCKLGAKVIGYSLEKYDNDLLFKKSGLNGCIIDERGDICDFKKLKHVITKYEPETIFHLAAQPLVRRSYDMPVQTFNVNVLGTVNVLECINSCDSIRSAVMITTDKVYKNKEKKTGYKETDELGGYDPYSSSKACAEITIESYKNSFFSYNDKLVASARAGNVIGGGDYSMDRLIPDCIKSLVQNKEIIIRNPYAIRPWQYVLDPLYGYLLLGARLIDKEKKFAEAWNFGPEKDSFIPVKDVVELVISNWGNGSWKDISNQSEKKHETNFLYLDNSKSKNKLGWMPRLGIKEGIKHTIEWYKKYEHEDVYDLCIKQIIDYEKLIK